MNSYELMLIVKADLTEEKSKKITDEIKSLLGQDGKVTEVKEWAKNKPLAYPIAKQQTGSYWLIMFEAIEKAILELSRKLKAHPEVIRHLVIRKD